MTKNFGSVACLAALVSVVPSLASAAFAPSQARITSVEIGPVSGTTGTTTFLSFSTSPGSVPTCHAGSSQYGLIGSVEHIRALTAMAMSAYLAGRPVRVEWNGCNNGPYALIKRIIVE
jgi:hypothetical protein